MRYKFVISAVMALSVGVLSLGPEVAAQSRPPSGSSSPLADVNMLSAKVG